MLFRSDTSIVGLQRPQQPPYSLGQPPSPLQPLTDTSSVGLQQPQQPPYSLGQRPPPQQPPYSRNHLHNFPNHPRNNHMVLGTPTTPRRLPVALTQSCTLCGTPYQRGPSYRTGPVDARIGHEQTRDRPRLCPACYSPTVTRPSPTGAQTRFLSSGRREYITGYPPSPSQPYLVGTTTANANANNTHLPHVSSAGVYRDVATTAYQASPADSLTSERMSHAQPQDYALGVYYYRRQHFTLQLTENLATTQQISPPCP